MSVSQFLNIFDPSNPPGNETFETLKDNTPQNISQHLVALYDAYPGGISDAYNTIAGSSSGIVTATNLESCSDTTYLSDDAQLYFHGYGMRVTSYPGIKISTETYETYVGAFFFTDYMDAGIHSEIQLFDLWGADGSKLLYRLSVYSDSKEIIFYDVQNGSSANIGYLNDETSAVYGVSFEYERAYDCFSFSLFDMDGGDLLLGTDIPRTFNCDKIYYIAIGGNSTALVLQSCAVYVNMKSYYKDISSDVLHDFLFCRPCLAYQYNSETIWLAKRRLSYLSSIICKQYIFIWYSIKLCL